MYKASSYGTEEYRRPPGIILSRGTENKQKMQKMKKTKKTPKNMQKK
jgi:hypothetical protein